MSKRTKRRIPTWLGLALLAVFLAMAVGVLAVKYRELPECARLEAFEGRFRKQLDFMRELALNHKGEASPPLPEAGGDDAKLREWLKRRDAWWSLVEKNTELFADPVILDAAVYLEHVPERRVSVNLIQFENKDQTREDPLEKAFLSFINALPESGEPPGPGRPTIRRVYTGTRESIEYKELIRDPTGTVKGLKLVVDLARLEAEEAP